MGKPYLDPNELKGIDNQSLAFLLRTLGNTSKYTETKLILDEAADRLEKQIITPAWSDGNETLHRD